MVRVVVPPVLLVPYIRWVPAGRYGTGVPLVWYYWYIAYHTSGGTTSRYQQVPVPPGTLGYPPWVPVPPACCCCWYHHTGTLLVPYYQCYSSARLPLVLWYTHLHIIMYYHCHDVISFISYSTFFQRAINSQQHNNIPS